MDDLPIDMIVTDFVDEDNPTLVVGIIVNIIAEIGLAVAQLEQENDGGAHESEDDDRLEGFVPNFFSLGNVEFKSHFRMLKGTFEAINNAVSLQLINTGVRFRPSQLPFSHQFLMVLWVLATPDSYRSVGLRFGINKGIVHYVYRKIIQALREIAPNYIKWPDQGERLRISQAFEQRSHYPGVIGCVDGTHINIKAPDHHPARYINRKSSYSLLLQGTCDHRLLFTDIYAGECGSLHDSRVFRRSPMSRALTLPGTLDDGQHLLGDGAYVLRKTIMIPYRDNGHLLPWQRNHNATLSSARVCIENAFALLKCKWRRLKYLDVQRLDYAVDEIVASCILHNHIILEGEELEGNEERDYGDGDDPEDGEEVQDDGGRDAGEEKRDRIAHALPPYVAARNRLR